MAPRKFYILSMATACLLMAIHSLYWVFGNYMTPPYWDAWEFFRTAAVNPKAIYSLGYMLEPHNSHMIVTSKALFAANFYFFRGASLPLIAFIVIINMLIAVSIALIGTEKRGKTELLLVFAISLTFLLSLAQWENLLWAFQPHMSLVSFFAVMTLYFLQGALQHQGKILISSFAFYTLFLTLTVYSLGNGFTIICGVLLMIVLSRTSLRQICIAVAIYLAIAAPFVWVARHGHNVGDPGLRTAANLVGFWFRMIGGPWTSSEQQALYLGAALAFCYALVTYRSAIIPWSRRTPVDQPTILLLAIAAFLVGTVIVTGWGRVTLGPTASLASRYATPMLILPLTLGLVAWRNTSAMKPAAALIGMRGLPVVLAGLGFWSHLKPANYGHIRAHLAPVEQASYFVASNVMAPEYIRALYPDAAAIQSAVRYLRDNRLSIFSRRLGLEGPSADLLEPVNFGNIQNCTHAALDEVVKLGNEGWAATGWAAHQTTRQTPSFVLAFDGDGRFLGYTRPVMVRSDVVRALNGAPDFRGFIVPIAGHSQLVVTGSTGIWLMAVFDRSPSACRVPIAAPLP